MITLRNLGIGLWLFTLSSLSGQIYRPSSESVPPPQQEFRAAWSACVYNIDWPSQKGLSASAQKAELVRMLDMMARLRMNALIFQVRPHCDAMYRSKYEPWSPWLTGGMGKSPGYDPLAYCIQQAHRRGIEVHAWFNPFRALPNAKMAVTSNHITQTSPQIIRKFKTYKWVDPSSPRGQQQALGVIIDVVKRYDIDGVHIDDYFYPYPSVNKDGSPKEIFPDGKTPAQRRGYVDGFVQRMYSSVKQTKPWVRVGISPFGIWRPGNPRGVKASIDSYYHLGCDSKKWLSKGWCDYMMPQLYWRIKGDQSFSALFKWWQSKGRRPVWPGIATSRIRSKEDRTRGSGEILNQLRLSRQSGRKYSGHCHWSVKSLLQNRDGIREVLTNSAYQQAALVPPMPWISRAVPQSPQLQVTTSSAGAVKARWSKVANARKYAIQARYGKNWMTVAVTSSGQTSMTFQVKPDAVAVRSIDAYGTISKATVAQR